MPGLTAAGLEIATLADVRAQINAKWAELFGVSMDTSDDSPDGQLIGIDAEQFALFWELLETIIASQDPDKATGAALDAICALTGTFRIPATFSTSLLTLTGTPTTPLPSGQLVSTRSTGQQFTTTTSAVILAVTAWVGSTVYAAGDRHTNGGNVYLCVIPGTSAASGGPSGTTVDITDGSAHWRFLGAGAGYVDVPSRAKVTGPLVAVSGDLTSIDTPVGGWLGAINILDAVLGRLVMTDAELRVLRELELARPGNATKRAIRSALFDVGVGTDDPVTSVTVFSNVTDITDADGVEPHSIEALVAGGASQDIWDALLASVAGGIRTHGSIVGTSIDSSGIAQTMKFSRVTQILVYVAITLVKDPNTYPSDGDAQVALAIATAGNAKDDGTDAVSSALLARVFSVPGVLDVSLPLIGTAPSPTLTATIAISLRQRAVYDTTRIAVASSDGVP